MGGAVAEGRQSKPKAASDLVGAPPMSGRHQPELRLDDLLLFDSAGNDPVVIKAMVFTDDGIGMIRTPGAAPRVLPWSAVSAHAVERWSGGVVPAWWVAPQPRPNGTPTPDHLTAPTGRSLPHADPGAVIAIQTPFGTYRFLRPAGDAVELSNRITDFAVRHQGLAGVPSMTMVASPRRGDDRRQGSRSRPPTSRWSRAKPFLTVALVVLTAAAITLILLQSTGAIHLPYLGGSGPGQITPVRTP
jgi:hypothetical protein